MLQAVLEGPALSGLLLRATDLVRIVHLKDGVFAETDEALQLLLVTAHLHRVEEIPSRLLREKERGRERGRGRGRGRRRGRERGRGRERERGLGR